MLPETVSPDVAVCAEWPPPESASWEDGKASEATSNRRDGLALIAVGAAPFLLAALMRAIGLAGQLPESCAFRFLIGLPCPLCGGTRAFLYATAGDPAFITYNGFWVFAALGIMLIGLVVFLNRNPLAGFWSRSGRFVTLMVISPLAGGWIWALVNRGTILS